MTSTNATSVLYLLEADAAIHPLDETALEARLLGVVVNGKISSVFVCIHLIAKSRLQLGSP